MAGGGGRIEAFGGEAKGTARRQLQGTGGMEDYRRERDFPARGREERQSAGPFRESDSTHFLILGEWWVSRALVRAPGP